MDGICGGWSMAGITSAIMRPSHTFLNSLHGGDDQQCIWLGMIHGVSSRNWTLTIPTPIIPTLPGRLE